MKKQLLFCSFLGALTACHQEADIQPDTTSLSGEVVGTYRTNFYLDPSYVAIPTSQMPRTELKAESDSNVTMIFTTLYPTQSSQVIQHVLLRRQADGIQLLSADSVIGTLQTDRIFTNSGMEKQGPLLRMRVQDGSPNAVSFSGVKQ